MANLDFTIEELASEHWKPVAGYEGLYSVSNLGQVRSDAPRRFRKPYGIMKPNTSKRFGYKRLTLTGYDGIQRIFTVHALVAKAWIPNPENLPQVNHKDTIKINCKVGNLEWCTAKYNMEHASQNGLLASGDRSPMHTNPEIRAYGEKNGMYTHPETRMPGEKNGNVKVTEEIVLAIRSDYASGHFSYRKLVRKYPLSQTQIVRIIKRESWLYL